MSNIKPFEVIVNSLSGDSYYNNVLLPRIVRRSKDWMKTRNWNKKKACLILSYDIDEKADIKELPKLLRLLKKYDIKASFAVIGLLAEKNPEMFQRLLDEGHELINHTYSHPDSKDFNPDKHFHEISSKERFDEISRCHKTVKRLFDYEMAGFRVPHFGYQYTKDIYPILKKLGYKYSSSTLAIKTKTAGFPYKEEKSKIWELPMICCPVHPYCIFDTSHAFRSRFARHDAKNYVETFKRLLDLGIIDNMFINLYQDPQDIGKFDYDKMLKMIHDKRKELWITTYVPLCHHLDKDGGSR